MIMTLIITQEDAIYARWRILHHDQVLCKLLIAIFALLCNME